MQRGLSAIAELLVVNTIIFVIMLVYIVYKLSCVIPIGMCVRVVFLRVVCVDMCSW